MSLLLLTVPSPAPLSAAAQEEMGEAARIVNATATMTFLVKEVPDSKGGGFEPHILAAPGVDGRQWTYIDSPTGLGSRTSGNLYISKDDGESWTYSTKGIVTGSWAGSGDSYTAVAKDGTIYFTDLLLATATIQASPDGGQSWVRNPAASVTPIDDRQWISMGPTVNGNPLQKPETLYMAYNQIPTGLWIMCSEYTSLGLGWKPGNRGRPLTSDVGARDLLAVDPHDGTVYLANTGSAGLSVFVSTDGAQSFTRMPVVDGGFDDFQNIFVVADVDEEGNLYLLWTDQRNVTLAVSPDGGQGWRLLTAASGNGTRVLPWVAAGDAGCAGMAWYETNVTGLSDGLDNATWDLVAVVTDDAFADNVTFHRSVVQTAVHNGTIRTTGSSGEADRDLGDFLGCDVDRLGRLLITYGDDGDEPAGQSNYDAAVMYARQSGGPYLRRGFGPVARFTHDADGLRVSVEGRDSYDQNGRGISRFFWDWGDGANTTEANSTAASHTYKAAGRYGLRLTVTNPDNMSASASVILSLKGPPPTEVGPWLLSLGGGAAVVAAALYLWRRQRQKVVAPAG